MMLENNDKSMMPPAGESMDGAGTSEAKLNTGYSGQPDELHDLFGGSAPGATVDEEDPLAALRNDPNYAALIRDLEYIAAQAHLLFQPAEETPSDGLWDKIQSKLGSEPEDPDA